MVMIAERGDDAAAGLQVPQHIDAGTDGEGRSMNVVAGEDDEIALERVRLIDNGANIGQGDEWTLVCIGDVNDTEAVERGGQVTDWYGVSREADTLRLDEHGVAANHAGNRDGAGRGDEKGAARDCSWR